MNNERPRAVDLALGPINLLRIPVEYRVSGSTKARQGPDQKLSRTLRGKEKPARCLIVGAQRRPAAARTSIERPYIAWLNRDAGVLRPQRGS